MRNALAGSMLLTSATVTAADKGPSDWQYGLLIYGWLPDISGELIHNIPDEGDSAAVEIDWFDLLDMAFMAAFEARKGDWAAFTDIIYFDLSGDRNRSVTLPGGDDVPLADGDWELEGWAWTVAGSYTPWRSNNSHLDLLAGARYLPVDSTVKVTGRGPLQQKLKLSKSVDLVDAIVGAKGQIGLNDKWFLSYYGDLGAGDSDITWQVMGGVGYRFNWGEVFLDCRHLEYDQEDDKLLQDVSFSGAMIGVGFRF